MKLLGKGGRSTYDGACELLEKRWSDEGNRGSIVGFGALMPGGSQKPEGNREWQAIDGEGGDDDRGTCDD